MIRGFLVAPPIGFLATALIVEVPKEAVFGAAYLFVATVVALVVGSWLKVAAQADETARPQQQAVPAPRPRTRRTAASTLRSAPASTAGQGSPPAARSSAAS